MYARSNAVGAPICPSPIPTVQSSQVDDLKRLLGEHALFHIFSQSSCLSKDVQKVAECKQAENGTNLVTFDELKREKEFAQQLVFHLDGSELETHAMMATADALVMSSSSFSASAGLLQSGAVFRPTLIKSTGFALGETPEWITVYDEGFRAMPIPCQVNGSGTISGSALGCATFEKARVRALNRRKYSSSH